MSECVFLVNFQVATRDSSGTSRNAQRRLVATIRRFQSGAPAAKRQQSSFLLALSRPSAPAPRHRVEVVLAGQHKARGFGAADYGLSSTKRIDQVRLRLPPLPGGAAVSRTRRGKCGQASGTTTPPTGAVGGEPALPLSITTSLPPRKDRDGLWAASKRLLDRCGPILLSRFHASPTHRRGDSP